MINKTYYYKENAGEAVNMEHFFLGNKEKEASLLEYLTLHRDDGPAYIETDNKGRVIHEEWYQHGKCHRENAPSFIYYDASGNISTERWFNNDRLYFLKSYYSSGEIYLMEWYKNDRLHREDGPARIELKKGGEEIRKQWYLEGKIIKGE